MIICYRNIEREHRLDVGIEGSLLNVFNPDCFISLLNEYEAVSAHILYRKDLLKVIHYGIMALHNHDMMEND